MSELKYTMLSKDVRPIQSLVMFEAQNAHEVGRDGITRISVVDETGEMAYVPWFEVWKGDALYCRTNAAYVSEVYYQEGQNRAS